MVDMLMRISPHFTLAELCKSGTADRLGISNMPGEAEVDALITVCEHVLERVRVHFSLPFSPNSGYRSLALNRTIGSKDTSQHVRGEAVDFELPGMDNLMLAHWCRENLMFDQLILEFYTPGVPSSGWVHCSVLKLVVDPKRHTNRRKVGTIIKGGGYIDGLPNKFRPHDRHSFA